MTDSVFVTYQNAPQGQKANQVLIEEALPIARLVMAGDFSVWGLLEDELVLELPLIARHGECPVQPKLQAADAAFVAEQTSREKPFTALAGLKLPKRGKGG